TGEGRLSTTLMGTPENGEKRKRAAQSSSIGQAALHLPAIEPFHRIVEAIGRAALPQVVAHQALDVHRMEDAAHLACRQHHAGGARDARALVQREGAAEVMI